ncbi:phage baseplate assembly protein V (plasmid) [Pantoea dispersa]|uniref:phage baseplate assembly protein V n=1 Tax=Pantoea dispersa TaxID=59814 RepID=UPI002222257D|nr:phage baseplate assembly protein V [Pantoea dispersa]UYV60079.1 phage baseplate assembly protein V [Pantoea dispersa]
MKPVTRLYLSTDETHLADASLVLELNSCGRGFITARTQTDYTGKVVRIDTGYADRVLRWFTGYVERSQPAETGYQRLFVRELSGVFDRSWPCSFQHPTLRQITAWLEENSGLTFSVPAADYSDKPIPHFTHSGTGFQLLGNLGRAFGISDYVWYQLPDGGMYVGGAEKSLFAGRPVDIPPEFSLGAAGGNSVTVPVIQSMRPGVELNGQRVTKVQLAGDTMTITWTPRNRTTGQPLQKTPLQRQIESQYPEMASGLHLPKMARVVASSEAVSSGNFADPFRPRYAVDVQLLDADGKPDGSTPVYPAVPLPVPMAGNDSGMFQFPPEGTLVEVGFTGGRPDKPFVRQTMPEGTSLPDVKPGEQLQQQREEVSQRVTQAGDWERKTDQAIRETSMAREVKADSETRELVSRTTTIRATDKTTVLGTASLMAGAVQQVTTGSYSMAAQGDQLITVGGNAETDITGSAAITVGQALTEKIGQLRQSIAGTRQEIIAPVVWIGSAQINVAQLMLDTVALVEQLANQLASHTHPDTGQPTNSAAIAQSGQQAAALNSKYSPVIGQ